MTPAEFLDRVMSRRREAGLTVVFRCYDGTWDEWGFADAARRDDHIRKLRAADREYHIPAWQ